MKIKALYICGIFFIVILHDIINDNREQRQDNKQPGGS